jgi:hypothetical protein
MAAQFQRGAPVRAHAKGILAAQIEQVAHLFEQRCDVVVVEHGGHGYALKGMPWPHIRSGVFALAVACDACTSPI